MKYEKPNYIGGALYQNFNWKPPEENTIDFQVKYVKEKELWQMVSETGTFRQIKLGDG